jgi:DNA-binding CsgD family transcriptional regulator
MQFDDLVPEINSDKSHLTKSENKQLLYAAKDLSIKEITKISNRTASTAKTQRQSILNKFGVRSMFRAITIAREMGIIVYRHKKEPRKKVDWHGKNLVAAFFMCMFGFYGAMPDSAYARPLIKPLGSQGQNENNNPYSRIKTKPARPIRLLRLRRGRNSRRELDILNAEEAGFYLAEK